VSIRLIASIPVVVIANEPSMLSVAVAPASVYISPIAMFTGLSPVTVTTGAVISAITLTNLVAVPTLFAASVAV
jgi:hypothetical protein